MNKVKVAPDLPMILAIIDMLLDEEKSLKESVAAHGITLGQFNRFVQQDREAKAALVGARQFQAHLMVEEAKTLADSDNDPAKVRNQMDIRKWTAERYNRPAYGQQIDISVTQAIDINAALSMAEARLLQPVRDQLTHAPGEALDVPSRIVHQVDNVELSARDQQPAAVAGPAAPDIFS